MKTIIHQFNALRIVLFLIIAASSPTLSAQKEDTPNLDSLFLMMNSNPDKVIRLGNELYKKYKGNPRMEISVLTIIGSSYSVKKD